MRKLILGVILCLSPINAADGTSVRLITLAELAKSLPKEPLNVVFDVDDTALAQRSRPHVDEFAHIGREAEQEIELQHARLLDVSRLKKKRFNRPALPIFGRKYREDRCSGAPAGIAWSVK